MVFPTNGIQYGIGGGLAPSPLSDNRRKYLAAVKR